MANISLFSPLQGDYASRSAELARQQKLAQMLEQMSQQEIPVSTAGGIAAPVSPYGALAKALSSFGGAYLSGKSAADEAEMKRAARAEAVAARNALYETPRETNPMAGGTYPLKVPESDYTPNVNSEFPEPIAQHAPPIPKLAQVLGQMPQQIGNINYNPPATPPSYEDQMRMLAEYELSDNPYIAQMAAAQRSRIEAERDRAAPNFAAAGTEGQVDINPNSPTFGQTIGAPEPKPANLPSDVQTALWRLGATPEEIAALDAVQNAKIPAGTSVTVKMPPGINKADEVMGEMYAKYITGDSASVSKNMNQLGMVINTIKAKPELFGNLSGVLPIEIRRAFPSLKEGANVQQMIEDVVQTNLRQVLGPQFTAKEGQGLMRRVFDPALPGATNADRGMRLLMSVQEAAKAKQDAMNYFGQNNTIAGYKPKIGMVGSVDEILQRAGLDVGFPEPNKNNQNNKKGVDYNNPLLK